MPREQLRASATPSGGAWNGAPEVRTSRLTLRAWRDGDLRPFAAMNADSRVMEYFPALLSERESNALVARIHRHFGAHGFGLWAVEVTGHASFAGFVGLTHSLFAAHFTPCVDLGWRLAREHWGKGYAREAARAVIQLAFERLALDQVVAFTAAENARSRRVMDALGMTRDERGDFDHPYVPAGHPLRRHVLYRLDRAGWHALSRARAYSRP